MMRRLTEPSAAPGPSPYPPIRVSLLRGLTAAGSPVPLGVAFVGLLGVWGAYALVGVPLSPRLLTNIMALPPIQTYFDVALVTSVPLGSAAAVSLFIALIAGRSLFLAGMGMLLCRALGWRPDPPRPAWRWLLRTAGVLFMILSVEAAGIIALPLLARSLGAGIEVLTFFAMLLGGLHFLGLAPAVATTEVEPAASLLRRTVRAARLPNGRQLLLVSGYVTFILWVSYFSPISQVAPATPTALVWALALVVTLVHAGVFATFLHRWLAVRGEVTGAPGPRRRP